MRASSELGSVTIGELSVYEELENAMPKRSDEQLEHLERQILTEGFIRDPFILWNYQDEIIVIDGHSRRRILERLIKDKGFSSLIPAYFYHFDSVEEAKAWIQDNQISRKNITDAEKAYFIGSSFSEAQENPEYLSAYISLKNLDKTLFENLGLKDAIAELHKVSPRTAHNHLDFYNGIQKIAQHNRSVAQQILSSEANGGQQAAVSFVNVIKYGKSNSKKKIESIDDVVMAVQGGSTEKKIKKEDDSLPEQIKKEMALFLKTPVEENKIALIEKIELLCAKNQKAVMAA